MVCVLLKQENSLPSLLYTLDAARQPASLRNRNRNNRISDAALHRLGSRRIARRWPRIRCGRPVGDVARWHPRFMIFSNETPPSRLPNSTPGRRLSARVVHPYRWLGTRGPARVLLLHDSTTPARSRSTYSPYSELYSILCIFLLLTALS